MIAKEELKSPDLLTDDEVAQLLPVLDDLISWAKQLQAYALNEALKGKKYDGFKVVAGRSQRKIVDPDGLIKKLEEADYNKELFYEKKLIGISGFEAIVGKKKFGEKPEGAPTLVSDDDPREPINKTESASADFAEENN